MFSKHLDAPIPSAVTANYFDKESIHICEADIVREAHAEGFTQ